MSEATQTAKGIAIRTAGNAKDWIDGIGLRDPAHVDTTELGGVLMMIEDLAEAVRILATEQEWRGKDAR